MDAFLKAAFEIEGLEEFVDGIHQKARGVLRDTENDGIHVGSVILLNQFVLWIAAKTHATKPASWPLHCRRRDNGISFQNECLNPPTMGPNG